ncbi:MAG: futalosine hydrolase [Phycisphaerae bacterium]|nr:futalosine hydrolase [Phycisphaerae bacterium]
MRLLIVTAVEAEAEAVGEIPNATVITSGIGRTNAAVATTEAILQRGPFDAVINMGVAGALPGSPLQIGSVIVATSCIYVEEGQDHPDGFQELSQMGMSLGDFSGNAVPVDPGLLNMLSAEFHAGPIATVATCSGTDQRAEAVRSRTGADAEAMEGAAVVHAARRLETPGIEIRVISNTTGDRDQQHWDLPAAFRSLQLAAEAVLEIAI